MQSRSTPNAPVDPSAGVPLRVASLDGLRGLAALVVLLRHTFNAIELPIAQQQQLFTSPLALVLNAQGAVQLFFVLSGFVLSASIARDQTARERVAYGLRRVLRIQLPYVFAVVVAFAASALYEPLPADAGVSRWLNHFLSVDVGVSQLLQFLLFPGTAGGLLDVGWTLRIELIVSLLLPFLWLAVRRSHPSFLLLLCLPLGLDTDWRMTWYVFDFGVGMWLFVERDRWLAALSRWPQRAAIAWMLTSLALFAAPMFAGTPPAILGRAVPGFARLDILSMGLGSAGLIMASMAFRPVAHVLSRRPLVLLGRISFSLYLLHKTILHLLVPVFAPLDGALPIALLFGAVVVVSLVGAALAYRFIEAPSIRLGRWVATRIRAG